MFAFDSFTLGWLAIAGIVLVAAILGTIKEANLRAFIKQSQEDAVRYRMYLTEVQMLQTRYFEMLARQEDLLTRAERILERFDGQTRAEQRPSMDTAITATRPQP